MNEREIHRSIDQFLFDAYSALWALAQGVAGLVGSLWRMMPYDWHPALKAAVLVVGLVVALRLLRVLLVCTKMLL